MSLEQIIAHGNRGHAYTENNKLRCADGFTVSVIAGQGTYCTPRPAFCFHGSHPKPGDPRLGEVGCEFSGPYTTVEVGYPSVRPEPWSEWVEHADDPSDAGSDVYGTVPVELVRDLVELHGGEVA